MSNPNIKLMTAIRAHGLTQREVAKQVGVHESRVSTWVRNSEVVPLAKHRAELVRIGILVYEEPDAENK